MEAIVGIYYMKKEKSSLKKHNAKQTAYYEEASYQNLKPEATPYVLRQIDELIKFGDIRPKSKVLEIGCGVGRYTLNLASRGVYVEGLDLSEYNLKKLKEFNENRFNLRLHCFDILSRPDKLKEKYDAAIGFFVLHHLFDLGGCFKSIYEMIKPGGMVTFMEPNPYNILFYIGITFTNQGSWSVDKGIVNMRRKKIMKLMGTAGFSQCSAKKFGLFPPFLVNHKSGRIIEKILEKSFVFKPFFAFQLFKGQKNNKTAQRII